MQGFKHSTARPPRHINREKAMSKQYPSDHVTTSFFISQHADLRPTLTEAENEILTISAWRAIGKKLNIPDMDLDKMDETMTSIKDRKRAMLKSWLENDNKASWSKLAQALEGIRGTLARGIRSKYCENLNELQPHKKSIGVR